MRHSRVEELLTSTYVGRGSLEQLLVFGIQITVVLKVAAMK